MNNRFPWFHYPNHHWQHNHAIVIGAGIAGCQIAWHLAKKDWKVTLIDREKTVAKQASGNPAGIISPKMTAQSSSGEDFYTTCFNYTIKQLTSLRKKHSNLDWHDCGLLQLAHNTREEKRWNSLVKRFEKKEFTDDFLQLLNEIECTHIAGIPISYKASYFPQAGWVNPVSFCETLVSDVSNQCDLITDCDILELKKNASTWNIYNHHKQIIASAEVVINTSGKDLHQFPQTKSLPSLPVLGQTTVANTTDFSSQLKTTIGHEGYLTPSSKRTSQLTFGASFDRNRENVEISAEVDQKNLEQLHQYLPDLTRSFDQINSAHAAIRMTTPDRFPYVGGIANSASYAKNYPDLHQGKHYKTYPNAEYETGLFVLAGLGSRGLTTSGLCAKTLSDILNNHHLEENQFIINHCHPARFIIKDLKRNRKE